MAENPAATLVRVLGGVILMQGGLGAQTLGQLLVANTNEVAIAAAALVVAGTSRQKNAVAQVALRTVAPLLAVEILIHKEEERLERREATFDEKNKLLQAREKSVSRREAALARRRPRRRLTPIMRRRRAPRKR